MKSSRYVGVSFLKGKIQFAEVEHKRKKLTVTVLAERTTSVDFAKVGVDSLSRASTVEYIRAGVERYHQTA